MIPLDGKEQMVTLLSTSATHIAFGTGTTPPNSEDTTLQTEIIRVAVSSFETSGREISFLATLSTAQGNGSALSEIGLFTASSGGIMIHRSTFITIDKTSSFSVNAKITLRFD